MEYYGNKLCISACELVDGGIITLPNYKQLSARGHIDVMRSGKELGRYTLAVVGSLPATYKEKVGETYSGGNAVLLRGWILPNYELDQAAVVYFMDWTTRQRSDETTDGFTRKYAVDAPVLNTCIQLYNRNYDYRKLMGEKYDWDMMAATIETLREEFGHDLLVGILHFRKKVNEYKQYGCECPISGKPDNQSVRKVDYKTERLIPSFVAQEDKPYDSNVYEMHIIFVHGGREAQDLSTGEVSNPDDFTGKNDDPKELSESVISNVLNKPNSKPFVNHVLMGYATLMHEQTPYVHRHNGKPPLS